MEQMDGTLFKAQVEDWADAHTALLSLLSILIGDVRQSGDGKR